MNKERRRSLSFAILDKEKGLPDLPMATKEEYPLPAWYRAVREIPLDKLGIGDICKACRQQIHLEYIVPIALDLLQTDPLTGEMYDGELLVSLKSVPTEYWIRHDTERWTLKLAAEPALQAGVATDDVCRDAKELLNKLAGQ